MAANVKRGQVVAVVAVAAAVVEVVAVIIVVVAVAIVVTTVVVLIKAIAQVRKIKIKTKLLMNLRNGFRSCLTGSRSESVAQPIR